MKFPAVISLIIFTTSTNLFLGRIKGESSLACSPCVGPDCDIENCSYGTFPNVFCDRLECRKGPNSTCGGIFDYRGKCGNGLSCHCHVCVGCSQVTFECYERSCMPKHFDESPFSHPQHFPYTKL